MLTLSFNATACSLSAAVLLALIGTAVFADETAASTAGAPAEIPSPETTGSDPEASAEPPDKPKSAIKATGVSAGLQRLEELNLLSGALVEKAELGSAPAHEFRIEARMYRELLRQTMLSDRERATNEQLPQPLLQDMVRMSALLHSAADCKTGFVITCPADLMLQLKAQQSRVTKGLRMTQTMYE